MYFASMIVRCTLGKGIRSGQEPGVDRDQQARRRDLINIISYLHFYITTNTSTIYIEVNIISSLHYSNLLNEFSDIIMIKVLAVGIPHAEATTQHNLCIGYGILYDIIDSNLLIRYSTMYGIIDSDLLIRYSAMSFIMIFQSDTVTGLFLSNESTIGPAVDLLALVLREASRDRR